MPTNSNHNQTAGKPTVHDFKNGQKVQFKAGPQSKTLSIGRVTGYGMNGSAVSVVHVEANGRTYKKYPVQLTKIAA